MNSSLKISSVEIIDHISGSSLKNQVDQTLTKLEIHQAHSIAHTSVSVAANSIAHTSVSVAEYMLHKNPIMNEKSGNNF